MSAALAAGLVLALALTSLVNLAYVREQRAVCRLPALSVRRPLTLVRLLAGSRPWLIGFAMEGAGFVLYVAALAAGAAGARAERHGGRPRHPGARQRARGAAAADEA